MADESTSVVACQVCGQRMRVAAANLGKEVRCPACHASVPTRVEEPIQAERPAPRPKLRRRDAARDYARELMRDARADERHRRADYGMPWYLWVLAVLPWGIPVLTLGGCLWVAIGGGISAGCFAIARATRIPIVYRTTFLIVINGIAYTVVVMILILAMLASNPGTRWFSWPANRDVAPRQGAEQQGEAPSKTEPPPNGKPRNAPPSAEGMRGLIAYWDFDAQANAGQVKDLSGRGNDATLHGTGLADGVRGRALQCNGRDAYCDLGDAPNLNFAAGAPFTIAGWVRTRAAAGTILSFRNTDNDGADIDITVEGGKLKALVRQNGGLFPHAILSRGAVHDDAWHHFAVTRSPEGAIELFIDGDSQGKLTSNESEGAITTNLRALGSERYWLRKGLKSVAGVPAFFVGSIDEVCIFDRVVPIEEIRTLAGQ
jgi:hypothetical protein